MAASPPRLIGDTRVMPVGLGGVHWSLASERDDELSVRTIRDALDAGVTFIDTAHAYTTLDEPSHNETIVRRALADHPRADDVLVATKGGHWRAGTRDFPIDGRPETLRAHLELSLRALGVDSIGLYQLHHPDPHVPIEDSVGALADFQRSGLVRLIGVSNFNGEQLRRAQATASISSLQNEFSPFHADEGGLIEATRRDSIAYLAHSPFGGKDKSSALAAGLPVARSIAEGRGWSVHRTVIAWMLSLSENVVPIVGARTSASIEDSVNGATQGLLQDEVEALNREFGAASKDERSR